MIGAMNAAGVESLFDQVRIGLTTLVDLLAADELQAVDACERLDLWQDVHAVLAQLTVVERAWLPQVSSRTGRARRTSPSGEGTVPPGSGDDRHPDCRRR